MATPIIALWYLILKHDLTFQSRIDLATRNAEAASIQQVSLDTGGLLNNLRRSSNLQIAVLHAQLRNGICWESDIIQVSKELLYWNGPHTISV